MHWPARAIPGQQFTNSARDRLKCRLPGHFNSLSLQGLKVSRFTDEKRFRVLEVKKQVFAPFYPEDTWNQVAFKATPPSHTNNTKTFIPRRYSIGERYSRCGVCYNFSAMAPKQGDGWNQRLNWWQNTKIINTYRRPWCNWLERFQNAVASMCRWPASYSLPWRRGRLLSYWISFLKRWQTGSRWNGGRKQRNEKSEDNASFFVPCRVYIEGWGSDY